MLPISYDVQKYCMCSWIAKMHYSRQLGRFWSTAWMWPPFWRWVCRVGGSALRAALELFLQLRGWMHECERRKWRSSRTNVSPPRLCKCVDFLQPYYLLSFHLCCTLNYKRWVFRAVRVCVCVFLWFPPCKQHTFIQRICDI